VRSSGGLQPHEPGLLFTLLLEFLPDQANQQTMQVPILVAQENWELADPARSWELVHGLITGPLSKARATSPRADEIKLRHFLPLAMKGNSRSQIEAFGVSTKYFSRTMESLKIKLSLSLFLFI
jgi:hypothetical protein